MNDVFYVESLKKSDTLCKVWRGLEGRGYVYSLENAGKFTQDEIDEHSNCYNNGITERAILCEKVEKEAVKIVLHKGII